MLPFCDRVVSKSLRNILPVWTRSWPVLRRPQTIGEHLRKKRLESGLRQAELARKLGISERTLSLWECDKVSPRWEHHSGIIEYLGHDPFPSCGLRDPYSNETTRVASLSPETIGGRIRIRRLELRLTVKECAETLKVAAKTLHAWEKQRHQPARGMEKRLIEFLD